MHYSKKGTPTIGGLFFIPIGLAVARVMGGSSTEISCTLLVTLAYAVIGLLDDILGLIKPDSFGLSQRIRLLLEVNTLDACLTGISSMSYFSLPKK